MGSGRREKGTRANMGKLGSPLSVDLGNFHRALCSSG